MGGGSYHPFGPFRGNTSSHKAQGLSDYGTPDHRKTYGNRRLAHGATPSNSDAIQVRRPVVFGWHCGQRAHLMALSELPRAAASLPRAAAFGAVCSAARCPQQLPFVADGLASDRFARKLEPERHGDSSPRELRLDADQLRNGSVLYSSGGNRVQFSLKLFELDSQNVSESVLAISPLRVPAPGIDTGLTTPIAPASLPPASLDSTSAGTDQLPEVRRAIVEGNTEAAPQTRLPAEPNPAGVKTRASDLVPGEVVHQVLPYVPQKARDTL